MNNERIEYGSPLGHTNHIRRIIENRPGTISCFESHNGCEACEIVAKEQAEKEVKNQEYHMQNTDPLNCDNCGVLIGRVYSGDLEGSYFYCLSCIK